MKLQVRSREVLKLVVGVDRAFWAEHIVTRKPGCWQSHRHISFILLIPRLLTQDIRQIVVSPVSTSDHYDDGMMEMENELDCMYAVVTDFLPTVLDHGNHLSSFHTQTFIFPHPPTFTQHSTPCYFRLIVSSYGVNIFILILSF